MSAANWLAQSGQSKRAISSFWEPILIGALNENLDQVSHRYAAMVIRQAMLANREGVRLGLADVPLGDLHGGFAAKALEARGGGVHTGQRVTGIRCEGGRAVAVETSEGREIRADYFVAATNPDSFPLVPNDVLRSLGGRLVQSKPVQVPIASLYIWFAGRVEIPPALCIPGGSFHWCFDRTGVLPRAENEGAVLVMVASAARQLSNAPQEDILAMGLGELAQALRCKLPEVSRWTVVTCRNATFSPWVGCDSVRPMQKTAIPNLFIAGDWTATGWPGTMEGAVRSGYSCAWQILSREGICCPVPVADLPPRGLAGLFFR
jgi:zeta-carotene desaturase